MDINAATSAAGTKVGTPSRAWDFIGLLKLRLNTLVLGAVAAGYVLSGATGVSMVELFLLLFGITLTGGGSSAINMALESDRDRLMDRTRNRPVASGRVTPEEALTFGALLCLTGTAVVCIGANPLAGLLTAVTILLYTVVYTPLKTLTPLNTWVGAIPGALPPLIGWAAGADALTARSLALFGIVFFWQFPHFYAIASMYREDYARGGFAMLPVVDPQGLRTGHQTVLLAVAFLPVSLLPTLFNLAGSFYFLGALVLSSIYLLFSLRAAILRKREAWRDLLRTSLIVLPGLFVLMIADRLAS